MNLMLLRSLLCCSLWLSLAVAAAAAAQHTATCRLRVQGYGPSKYGVKAAELSCQTSNGELLQVHTEPSIINDTNSKFEGVVVPKGRPTCKGYRSDPQDPPHGMLYFCDSRYNVQFVNPQVQNVSWEGRYDNIGVAGFGKYLWHVLFLGGNVTATFTGGVFSGNRVNLGGVLHVTGCQTIISDCVFSNNTGNFGAAFLGAGTSEIRVVHSSFSHNNVVLSRDVAVRVQRQDPLGLVGIFQSSVEVSMCQFSSNLLEWGASTLSAIAADVKLQHTRFSNNIGNTKAACYFMNATVNISNTVFEHNSALSPDYGRGAAMLISTSRVHISDCQFIGNIANNGGVLFVDGNSDVYAGGTMFFNNTSVEDGDNSGFGGVFNVQAGNLTLDNCVARMNTAGSGGVISAAAYANVSISNASTLVANHASSAGGAVLLLGQALLRFTDSTAINNTAGQAGGAVLASTQSMAMLLRAIVANNSVAAQGSYSGGGGLYADKSAKVTLLETLVNSNTADVGGGVGIKNQAVLQIDNSNIEHNYARVQGGGVVVEEGMLHIIGDSHIRFNKAGDSAGGIACLTTHFDPQQVKSAVHNNTAKYVDNVGVAPTKMVISPASPNQPGLVQSILDDGAIPYVLNITGVHSMPSGGLSLIAQVMDTLNPSVHIRFMNITEEDGLVYFYLRLPPSKYVVIVTVDLSPEAGQMNFTIDLPSCSLGQISGANGVCQTCPEGSYTFLTGGSTCWPCPGNAECSDGDVITPDPAFWRSSPLSDQVQRCPNPIACKPKNASSLEVCTTQSLQQIRDSAAARVVITTTTCMGTRYSDLHCSSGYRGNLCGVCEAGFGSSSAFTCGKCMSFGVMVGLYVLAGCILLGFIKLLCHFTLAETMTARLPSNALFPAGAKQGAQVTDLLKPFVIYMQYLLILAMLKVEWPATISYPIKGLAWVFSTTSPETLSVECLFSSGGLPMGIKKTLFYLIAPLVMLVALLLIEGIAFMLHLRAARTSDAGVWDRLASSTIVVMFFFLPSLARTSLSMFACIAIDQLGTSTTDIGLAAVGRYWLLDLNQQCYSGYHLRWSTGLGVPLLIMVCCTLPGAIFYLAWCNRKHLDDVSFARHYGFLFRTYKPACCFWEGVIALQTIGFVAISVFGHSLGSYYQIVLVIFVLIMVAVTLIAFKPYEHTISQQAMEYGLLCLLLTALSTLTLLPDGFVQGGDTNKQYRLAMGVLLVLLNAAFVAWIAVQLFRLVEWSRVVLNLKSFVSSMLGVAHRPWRTPGCMRLLNSAKDTCLRS